MQMRVEERIQPSGSEPENAAIKVDISVSDNAVSHKEQVARKIRQEQAMT